MIESRAPDHPPRAGVIFDLDGTLADTLADIAAALNAALHAYGHPAAPLDRVRAWVGEGLPTLCRRALPGADDATLHRFTAAALRSYFAHPCDHTTLYPAIRELLDVLARRTIPLAVLSNKPHDLTVQTISALGVAERFNLIRGYRSEQDKKPSPAAALDIARAWQIAPAQILFVGDSQADVATALAAGMIPVAATWGFRSRDELAAAGATIFVDHPAQIAELPQLR